MQYRFLHVKISQKMFVDFGLEKKKKYKTLQGIAMKLGKYITYFDF